MTDLIDRLLVCFRCALPKNYTFSIAGLTIGERLSVISSTMALSIGFWFVVGIGPTLQYYLFSFIRSETASIYGSAYQSSLAQFPTLESWLLSALYWPFLVVSLVIVCASLRRPTVRDIFFAAAISSFFALMSLDLVFALVSGSMRADFVFENLLANFFGSPILALIFIAIIFLGNICVERSAGPIIWRQLVASIVTILIGVSLCVTSYYAADLLYRPVPVQIDAIIDAPANGFIAGPKQDTHESKDEDGREPFFPIPTKLSSQTELKWKLGTDNPLSINWASAIGPSTFDVAIEVVADCVGDRIQILQQTDANVVRFRNATKLRISLDGEMGEFSTVGKNSLDGTLSLSGISLAMFSIDRSTDTKEIKTTLSTNEPMEILHKSNATEMIFHLNADLAKADGDKVVSADRTYQVEIDGVTYVIKGVGSGGSRKVGELNCRSLRNSMQAARGAPSVFVAQAFIGLRIRITRKADAPIQLPFSVLRIKGQGGWLELTQPGASNDMAGKGAVEYVGFKGNVSNLDAAGLTVPARSIDEFQAFGDFKGRFEDGTKIRLSGKAKAFWKNGARVNPTKWEQLSETVRLAVVGAVWAGLITMVTFLWRIIGRNRKVDWRRIGTSKA